MPHHPYFPLPCPNGQGTLLLTPCPGTVEADLKNSIADLKTAGATVIVTLLTGAEIIQYKVEKIEGYCADYDITWFHLPVEDEGAPSDEFARIWREIRARIHARLDKNEAVVIHCKGGSGRTGVVAAQILMERGGPMKDAVDQVKALRPNAFAHAVQVYYITELAKKV